MKRQNVKEIAEIEALKYVEKYGAVPTEQAFYWAYLAGFDKARNEDADVVDFMYQGFDRSQRKHMYEENLQDILNDYE